jgi:hypothetical protein
MFIILTVMTVLNKVLKKQKKKNEYKKIFVA